MAQFSYSKKDFIDAIKYARNSLKYDDIALDAHFLLGMCYNHIKDFKNAVEHFENYLMCYTFDIRYKKLVLDNWFGNNVQLFEANYFCAHSYYELQEYEQASIYFSECINKFSFEGKGEAMYWELQFLAKQMVQIIEDEHNINFDKEVPVIIITKSLSYVCIASSDASLSDTFEKEFGKEYIVSNVKSLPDLLHKNKKSEYVTYNLNIIIDLDFTEEEICNYAKKLHEYNSFTQILVFSDKLKISNSEQYFIDRVYPLIPNFEFVFSDIREISDKKNKENNDSFLDFLND